MKIFCAIYLILAIAGLVVAYREFKNAVKVDDKEPFLHDDIA